MPTPTQTLTPRRTACQVMSGVSGVYRLAMAQPEKASVLDQNYLFDLIQHRSWPAAGIHLNKDAVDLPDPGQALRGRERQVNDRIEVAASQDRIRDGALLRHPDDAQRIAAQHDLLPERVLTFEEVLRDGGAED